ncbi:MAG: NusG domain II-containing protein [Ruminococcus sp.]
MKNRVWIIIFSAVLLVSLGAWIFVTNFNFSTNIVGIYQDNKLVKTIDLNSVTEETEIELKSENGSNTILVSNGHIRMKSADCPDKICVKHGDLTESGTPIICLPHKVIIQFENPNSDIDAVAGAE